MMRMQPPQLLTDLYRDLRDRRLLLPAAALLVALVAVPLLLRTSSPPPAQLAAVSVEPTAASPAVLVEQSGIRNYRKRLEALTKKNPFDQKFPLPELGSTGSGDSVAGGAGEVGGDLGLHAGAETTREERSTGSSESAGESRGGSEAKSTGTAGDEEKPAEETTKLISRRIDVKIGPAGEAKEIKDVRALDLIPSDEVPVTAFLGVNESGKRAAFLVSSDIVSSRGDGRCVPAPPAQCLFLVLEVGEQRRLVYQPEGTDEPTTYRLEVLRIRDVVVKSFDD